MGAVGVDERAFDERYRQWARRAGELCAEASRYIPGGAGSSARTVKFGWKPYPPFMAEGSGPRLRGVLFHPSQYENLFLSLVHTAGDVEAMLGAAQEAFAVIG